MKIASRKLILRRPTGDTEIFIDLFLPEQDGKIWQCRYEIGWPGGKWKSYAGGNDSIQAIVMALQKIAVEIYFSDEHKSGNLSWGQEWRGYGFPVPRDARDLLTGDDAKFF